MFVKKNAQGNGIVFPGIVAKKAPQKRMTSE